MGSHRSGVKSGRGPLTDFGEPRRGSPRLHLLPFRTDAVREHRPSDVAAAELLRARGAVGCQGAGRVDVTELGPPVDAVELDARDRCRTAVAVCGDVDRRGTDHGGHQEARGRQAAERRPPAPGLLLGEPPGAVDAESEPSPRVVRLGLERGPDARGLAAQAGAREYGEDQLAQGLGAIPAALDVLEGRVARRAGFAAFREGGERLPMTLAPGAASYPRVASPPGACSS